MNTSKKLQMINLAYTNGNFQRAYELSDELILESTDKTEVNMGWILKGLSAGNLSTPNREKLTEAQSYFKAAEKNGAVKEQLLDGAKGLSAIALSHVTQLKDFYTNFNEGKVKSQKGKVVHRADEDIGEHVGKEVGQALFDGIYSGERSRKASVELGKHFETNHSKAIITTLDYAFEVTNADSEVIQNIAKVIEVLIDTDSIMPMAKRRFRAAIDPLVQKIWNLDPQTSIYYLKDSDKLTCPNCGYHIIKVEKPERGCLLIGVMTIITLGIYLVVYLVDSLLLGNKEVVESAKKGQNLTCVTCNHQWIHG